MMYFEMSRQFDSSNKRGKHLHTCVQLQHQSDGWSVWTGRCCDVTPQPPPFSSQVNNMAALNVTTRTAVSVHSKAFPFRPRPLQHPPHLLPCPHPLTIQILRLGRADWPLIPVVYKRASKYTQRLIKVGHPLLKPISVLWDEKVISPPSP